MPDRAGHDRNCKCRFPSPAGMTKGDKRLVLCPAMLCYAIAMFLLCLLCFAMILRCLLCHCDVLLRFCYKLLCFCYVLQSRRTWSSFSQSAISNSKECPLTLAPSTGSGQALSHVGEKVKPASRDDGATLQRRWIPDQVGDDRRENAPSPFPLPRWGEGEKGASGAF